LNSRQRWYLIFAALAAMAVLAGYFLVRNQCLGRCLSGDAKCQELCKGRHFCPAVK
jgi:hypothetical protein